MTIHEISHNYPPSAKLSEGMLESHIHYPLYPIGQEGIILLQGIAVEDLYLQNSHIGLFLGI